MNKYIVCTFGFDCFTEFFTSRSITDIKRMLLITEYFPNDYYCRQFGLENSKSNAFLTALCFASNKSENRKHQLKDLGKYSILKDYTAAVIVSTISDEDVNALFEYAFTGGEGEQYGNPCKDWTTITVTEYEEPTSVYEKFKPNKYCRDDIQRKLYEHVEEKLDSCLNEDDSEGINGDSIHDSNITKEQLDRELEEYASKRDIIMDSLRFKKKKQSEENKCDPEGINGDSIHDPNITKEQLDRELEEYASKRDLKFKKKKQSEENKCDPEGINGDSIHDPNITKEQLDRELDDYVSKRDLIANAISCYKLKRCVELEHSNPNLSYDDIEKITSYEWDSMNEVEKAPFYKLVKYLFR